MDRSQKCQAVTIKTKQVSFKFFDVFHRSVAITEMYDGHLRWSVGVGCHVSRACLPEVLEDQQNQERHPFLSLPETHIQHSQRG